MKEAGRVSRLSNALVSATSRQRCPGYTSHEPFPKLGRLQWPDEMGFCMERSDTPASIVHVLTRFDEISANKVSGNPLSIYAHGRIRTPNVSTAGTSTGHSDEERRAVWNGYRQYAPFLHTSYRLPVNCFT
jgi:hypothetical protein